MPDLLVRLYALQDGSRWEQQATAAGVTIRRAEPWDRIALLRFIEQHFGATWASETEMAFSGGHPITAFVAVHDGRICGFAAYECTRRGYFGPTGVREDLRGKGIGAALLIGCLQSMRNMGYAYAVIGGADADDFYGRVCGATPIEGSEVGVYSSLYAERAERRRQPRTASGERDAPAT